jgi:uncharacterized protein
MPAPARPRRRPFLLPALGGLALVLGAAAFSGCAALDEQQRRWIFQPGTRTWWSGAAAAEGMQERWIDFKSTSSGEAVKLHAL